MSKTTVTKEQVQALLDQYVREQTTATEAAIAAYERKIDAETQAEEEQLRDRMNEVSADARAQYDAEAVKALIARRAAQEQVARWGLSRSGTAKTRLQGISDAAATAAKRTAAQERASLDKISQQLLSASKTAQTKKDQHAASARKTLASKTAEKRVTLMKGVTG